MSFVIGSAFGAAGPIGLPTDPRQTAFPYSSAVDFSFLLDPPAGKHGFLAADTSGHFRFEDGLRARFWGVNIAKESVFADHETIDGVVDVLARAGVNLVRFHHIDGTEGLLDGTRDDPLGYFNAKKLDALDYWIFRLKERGIYVYLDLLDYRAFTGDEGVTRGEDLGRGAKPYAVFDPQLIQLQEEYASKLLVEHVNRFTGLSLAQDPAVCLVEIFDENGLFSRRKELLVLKSPYRQELTALWNRWLKDKYKTTQRLGQAWTDPRGEGALLRFESLEKANVGLPALTLRPAEYDDNVGREGMARKNDGALFFYEVHRRYFSRIRNFLRERGVRIPIGAVGSLEGMPDLKAIADTLDYVGINYYWDHPFWNPGREWTAPYFFRNANPLDRVGQGTLGPTIALSRMKGKPLVVREWSYCWPNAYRCMGAVEMAALCGLQDVDAAVAFTFGTRSGKNAPDPSAEGSAGSEVSARADLFDFHTDPTRWGLFALAGKAFQLGEISPGKHVVEVAYSAVDVFSFFGYESSLYQLAWVTRLQNVFYDTEYEASADLTIASGRSASGRLRGDRLILFNNTDRADLSGNLSRSSLAELSGYRLPSSVALEAGIQGPDQGKGPADQPLHASSPLYEETKRPAGAEPQGRMGARNPEPTAPPASPSPAPPPPDGTWFSVPSILAAGHRPVETNRDVTWARGFFDPSRGNYVFKRLPPGEALGLAFTTVNGGSGDPLRTLLREGPRFRSDTGQIIRNTAQGTLALNTPTTQAIATAQGSAVWMGAGDLLVFSQSPIYAAVATSLDGRPLAESTHYVIKMVTLAENAGEKKQRVAADPPAFRIVEAGEGPPATLGRTSFEPTRVTLAGQEVLAIYMVNGTWELVRDGETFVLFCDTDGVKVEASGLAGTVSAGTALEWKRASSEGPG